MTTYPSDLVPHEPVKNLTPAVCPNCEEEGYLVQRDRQTTEQAVLGFNEEGVPEYGPSVWLDGGEVVWLCCSCWSETNEGESLEVTFDDE